MRKSRLVVSSVVLSGLLATLSPAAGAELLQPASPARHLGSSPKSAPSLTPGPRDALTRALASGRLNEAQYALERALSVTDRARVARSFGRVDRVDPRSVTMLYRDLFVRRDELTGADRRTAARLLARPTDNDDDFEAERGWKYPGAATVDFECGAEVCVHWADSPEDAPDSADGDGDTVPDYVETALQVFEGQVWTKITGTFGFRAPRPDDTSADGGPDDGLDVYLVDTGAEGVYGYCTSDDTRNGWSVSAYCAVDNDFDPAQFTSGASGLDALRVTAAHEFFHAVQFAYDAGEDAWLMEGTAVWVEDRIYPGINDHHQYLATSVLRFPRIPIDFWDPAPQENTGVPAFGFLQYGAFLFWQFMSQDLGAGPGSDPSVIRAVWNRADAGLGAPDDSSIRAARHVAGRRGPGFRTMFGRFGARNYVYDRYYTEGQAFFRKLKARRPPLSGRSFNLGRRRNRTGRFFVMNPHLSNSYVAFKRGDGVTRRSRLRISVDAPGTYRGSSANLVLFKNGGGVSDTPLTLNRKGNGSKALRFRQFKRVVLVLTNGSTRYRRCTKTGEDRTVLACGGVSKDDGVRGLKFFFSARLHGTSRGSGRPASAA